MFQNDQFYFKFYFRIKQCYQTQCHEFFIHLEQESKTLLLIVHWTRTPQDGTSRGRDEVVTFREFLRRPRTMTSRSCGGLLWTYKTNYQKFSKISHSLKTKISSLNNDFVLILVFFICYPEIEQFGWKLPFLVHIDIRAPQDFDVLNYRSHFWFTSNINFDDLNSNFLTKMQF